MRAQHLVVLGCRCVRGVGIPSAGAMIWDFNRKLYCSAPKIALSAFHNLDDSVLRERLQEYFGRAGILVRIGAQALRINCRL
jgi:hypothetical protein